MSDSAPSVSEPAESAPPAPVLADSDVALDEGAGLGKRLAAEAIGTALLVLAVLGGALFFGSGLVVAFAVGFAVLAGAYAFGHVSGGHFNPAVTLGAAVAGRFAWRDVPWYVLAQLVGGALASTLVYGLLANAQDGALEAAVQNGFASNGYDTHSAGGFGLPAVLGIEIVITFLFLLVILSVTDRRAPSGFAPLAIGLALTVFHFIAIPVSNASLNPARSIATAIYGGGWAWEQIWVFIVGPLLGALIAGILYQPLLGARQRD